jgi:hypothetical protein
MKKYITSTIVFLACLHISHAQGNASAEISKICKPYFYSGGGSLFGKNLYFESVWVKAKLLKADNNIISSDSFLFNFDKIERKLLVTADLKNIFEIDRREFKAILFYWHDSTYIFKHINFINDKDLFQVIINDNGKYSLFKVIHTKFIKANNSGVGSLLPSAFGALDRYQDVAEYYIFFPNREYKTIFNIRRTSIERIFDLNPDTEKVENYLHSTNNKEFGENDLIQLILYLNN